MKALLAVDKDAGTAVSQDLVRRIADLLKQQGYGCEVVEVGRDDVSPCLGCLKCFTERRGVCVHHDTASEIAHALRVEKRYELTAHVTPVRFGHFSSVMKNLTDRGITSNRWHINIGYGEDIDEEEKSTFIDITSRHRGTADIVHPGMDERVDVYVTRSAEESGALCATLKAALESHATG